MTKYNWNNKTLTETELEEYFSEILDEIYSPIEIFGIPVSYSYIVHNVDYIAFREAFLEWIDSEGISEL